MALQDNFNAIYNKKEQAKQQKEAEKQKNLLFEIQLQELLQDYITEYLTTHKAIDILLSSTKRRIIARILRENTFAVDRFSKYKNIDNIETYLLLHYDRIANKCLRIAKLFDKELGNDGQIKNIIIQSGEHKIENELKEAETIESKHNFEGLKTFGLYAIAGTVGFLSGFLNITKNTNPRQRRKKFRF